MDQGVGHSDFIYVYGLILASETKNKEIPEFEGIDHKRSYSKNYKEILFIASPVSPMEFSQELLDNHLKNPEWLQEKAFHHHKCISQLHTEFTVLPMSFCTIFKDEQSLERMLSEHYDRILQKLQELCGKQEWNLKVYCHTESWSSSISHNNTNILEFQEQIKKMPLGKQYLMKKKLQNFISEELEKEQKSQLEHCHQPLMGLATDCIIRKNWGQEITQRKEDMIWNCDYLVHANKVESFLNCIHELEQFQEYHDWSFEITGPWPPYHFAKMKTGDKR